MMEYNFDMMKQKIDRLKEHMPEAYKHWNESGMINCKSFAEVYKNKSLF